MMTPKFNDKVSKQSTNEKEKDSEPKQSSRTLRNSQIEGIPMRTSNIPLRQSNVKVGGMNGISILQKQHNSVQMNKVIYKLQMNQ